MNYLEFLILYYCSKLWNSSVYQNLSYDLSPCNFLFLTINMCSLKHFWYIIKNVLGLYVYFTVVYRFFFNEALWIYLKVFSSNSIQIWNSRTGQCTCVYDEHSEQVNCCQFNNRSGQYLLATCSNDTFIKVSGKGWDYSHTAFHNKIIIYVYLNMKN